MVVRAVNGGKSCVRKIQLCTEGFMHASRHSSEFSPFCSGSHAASLCPPTLWYPAQLGYEGWLEECDVLNRTACRAAWQAAVQQLSLRPTVACLVGGQVRLSPCRRETARIVTASTVPVRISCLLSCCGTQETDRSESTSRSACSTGLAGTAVSVTLRP